MEKCGWLVFFCASCLATSTIFADDRIVFNEEDERRWNTPPVLIPEPVDKSLKHDVNPQARFFPFAATISLSSGANNGHSLSLGATDEGLSLSQSTSHSSGPGGSNGKGPGLSASQSSSFSAGLSGISGSDANAFNLNHPIFGGTAQADSNSFSFGDATAQSHGSVANGQATSGAQSGVGGASSGASSIAGSGHSSSQGNAAASQSDRHHDRPAWNNFGPNADRGPNHRVQNTAWRPDHGPSSGFGHDYRGHDHGHANRPGNSFGNAHNGPFNQQHGPHNGPCSGQCSNCAPTRPQYESNSGYLQTGSGQNAGPGCGNGPQDTQVTGGWSSGSGSNQHQGTQILAASASSGASSSGNGFSIGQSVSQSHSGSNGPWSSTEHKVQTSGNGQAFSQGAAAAVGQNSGQTDASFSSGSLAGSSSGNGQTLGWAGSSNRGEHSRGQVDSQAVGTGNVQGTANAGSVNFFRFPDEPAQNIPKEFVRNRHESRNGRRKKDRHPVDDIISQITDSVVDLFDA